MSEVFFKSVLTNPKSFSVDRCYSAIPAPVIFVDHGSAAKTEMDTALSDFGSGGRVLKWKRTDWLFIWKITFQPWKACMSHIFVILKTALQCVVCLLKLLQLIIKEKYVWIMVNVQDIMATRDASWGIEVICWCWYHMHVHLRFLLIHFHTVNLLAVFYNTSSFWTNVEKVCTAWTFSSVNGNQCWHVFLTFVYTWDMWLYT